MKRVTIVLCLMATSAIAKPPLSEVDVINTGLRDVKIADEIRSNCSGISARMVAAWSRLDGLKRKARSMGYSDDEIENFVESKSDRKRIEKEADAYMKAGGVTRGKNATYCALGKKEISSGSDIGTLLRER